MIHSSWTTFGRHCLDMPRVGAGEVFGDEQRDVAAGHGNDRPPEALQGGTTVPAVWGHFA